MLEYPEDISPFSQSWLGCLLGLFLYPNYCESFGSHELNVMMEVQNVFRNLFQIKPLPEH